MLLWLRPAFVILTEACSLQQAGRTPMKQSCRVSRGHQGGPHAQHPKNLSMAMLMCNTHNCAMQRPPPPSGRQNQPENRQSLNPRRLGLTAPFMRQQTEYSQSRFAFSGLSSHGMHRPCTRPRSWVQVLCKGPTVCSPRFSAQLTPSCWSSTRTNPLQGSWKDCQDSSLALASCNVRRATTGVHSLNTCDIFGLSPKPKKA